MHYLFDPPGLAALAHFMQQRPLLAFDFDGTLAPIVDHPDEARVPEPVSLLLHQLAAQLPVAIISGRSASDIQPRLGFTPAYVVGNHGAEGAGLKPIGHQAPELLPLKQRLSTWQATLEKQGVLIEDKGASMALHYRLAHNLPQALQSIDQALANLEPDLSVFSGKFVVNVVPSTAHDKANALEYLQTQSEVGAAVFVGDDVNDEAVFSRGHAHWLTVRVGWDDPYSKAQYCLNSTQEMPRLLQHMIEGVANGPNP